MCTAVSVCGKNHYFGRNLDFTFEFGEKITITPRNYVFNFRNGEVIKSHEAIIGMAISEDNYPLYFEGTNESGLSVAGLYFPGNACYNEPRKGRINVASFELIPWILCKCKAADGAEMILSEINITNEAFSEKIKPTPLHWIIADKNKALTLEITKEGTKIYKNPVGVLTNNPEFPYHIYNLNNYMSVSAEEPENKFSASLDLEPYSKGMGAIGLPGDNSSVSRFIRAAFAAQNAVWSEDENKNIRQFFHILHSVFQQKGTVRTKGGYEMTNYTSCCDTDKGVYYYTTYYNGNISAVSMQNENLSGDKIISYEIKKEEKINLQNLTKR